MATSQLGQRIERLMEYEGEKARERYEKTAQHSKAGTGKRFAALKAAVAARHDVMDPGAVAAAIGRKKYGAAGMAKLSAKGR
jgi:hypothetical protein